MTRCMGCMKQLQQSGEICPYCGYAQGTAPREAYHLEPGTILAQRYIAGRVLGYGGFGITYIGWDEQLMRKVAIKEFLPSSFATRMPGFTNVSVYGGEAQEQFQAGLQRFVDEARRLARFNGILGIVDIYDTFVENSTAYIVMEYLQGQDVKKRMETQGLFPYEEARDIILKICETLKPVHSQGVIHRDIAPDNIYLTDSGEVKLLDFGASRYATSINSKSLSVILKAGYAPEEQYRSRGDQGTWSDVYALAATFYKMITGVTPEDAMERAIEDNLKEPSKLGAKLPKAGENAILNAMNIRKENRTQTVEQFASELHSDGVERVKEKACRQDSGSMPLWGKVLICGSVALTLLFGLLTVTGVVDLGQGNLLKDTFGPALQQGYVNAPGILNQMEQEARKQVEKAGLDYLIVGKEYSDDIAEGKILTQSPLPGRVIATGSLLEVTISGGSKSQAIAKGEVTMPDISFMEISQAMYTLEQAGFYYYSDYEYSDTVAAGLVTRYELTESGNGAKLYVSAGKDGQYGTWGKMAAPYLESTGNGLLLSVALVGVSNLEKGCDYQIRYSLDQGGSWMFLKNVDGQPFREYTTYYTGEYVPVASLAFLLDDVILLGNQDLLNRELTLEICRMEETSDGNGKLIGERILVPGTAMVQASEGAIEVTGYEELDWDTIKEMNKKGELGSYHQLANMLQYEDNLTYNQPWRLFADVKQGRRYRLVSEDYNVGRRTGTINCVKDGELLFDTNIYQIERMERGEIVNWYLYEYLDESIEEHNKVSSLVRSLQTITIANGQMTVLPESTSPAQVGALLGFPNTELRFEASTKPLGTVVRPSFINGREFLVVSAGPSEGRQQPEVLQAMALYPQGYEKWLWAGTWLSEENNYYPQTEYMVLCATGQDKEFKPILRPDGYPQRAHLMTYQEDSINAATLYADLPMDLFLQNNQFWQQDLYFAIEGSNRVEAQDSLYVLPSHDKPGVTVVEVLSMNSIPQYVAAGRMEQDAMYYYESYQKAEDKQNYNTLYLRLEGNFKTGSSYYVMPGGEENTGRPVMCLQDGELIVSIYGEKTFINENRERYVNTLVQQVSFTYDNERKRLTAHISPPEWVDCSVVLNQ